MSQYSTDSNNISIDFSLFPFCFRCVSLGNFTNKLKDGNQFFKLFKRLFEIDIPSLTQYSFNDIVRATNKHSHSIQINTKEYSIVINIIEKLYKSYYGQNMSNFNLFLENNINEYYMWQLGISSGIRLIGIRRSNIFSVLFIDYHHLIYPDKNYNQENYKLYNFCPITNNNGGINNE